MFKGGFKIVQYVILTLISLALLYWAFRKQDVESIFKDILKADWSWVWLSLVATMFSIIMRALRWKQLLADNAQNVSLMSSYHGIMSGYFASTVIPRSGEFARCFLLQRTDQTPVSTSLGTVVTERIIDILTLLLFVVAGVLYDFDLLSNFFNINIYVPLQNLFLQHQTAFIITAILLIPAGFFTYIYIDKKYLKGEKSESFLAEFTRSMLSILKSKNKISFTLYTILIWGGYFYTTYFCFFAFESTSFLGYGVGLSMIGVGSLVRSMPTQANGAGAFHIIIPQLLLLYAVDLNSGLALATLIHGSQTLFYLMLGGISFVYMMLNKKHAAKN